MTLPVHDLEAILPGLAELRVRADTSDAEAGAAMRVLQTFNRCMVGLARFSGRTPWERHSEDELLHVLEGEVEITVLTEREQIETRARPGSVVIVPRECWHRQNAEGRVTLPFVTSEEGNAVSYADDPRVGP
jgi:mannose-6-phosphate isomerase-like protein (cupin superfamily)